MIRSPCLHPNVPTSEMQTADSGVTVTSLALQGIYTPHCHLCISALAGSFHALFGSVSSARPQLSHQPKNPNGSQHQTMHSAKAQASHHHNFYNNGSNHTKKVANCPKLAPHPEKKGPPANSQVSRSKSVSPKAHPSMQACMHHVLTPNGHALP